MPVTISQKDYLDLINQSECKKNLSHEDKSDITYQYPEQLGQGTYREVQLRQGVELAIERYQLHDDVIINSPERSHLLEYEFVMGKFTTTPIPSGEYALYGSGVAPREKCEHSAAEPIVGINVHIEPDVFQSFLGDRELASMGLEHLLRKGDRYYHRRGTTTVAMQTVLHQILHCPFVGISKKIYLESKVWELMAFLIKEEQERHQIEHSNFALKADEIDRIYHAKEILRNSLDNPPSLNELARKIGSNRCTLTRGFREVFGTTAFGYLHEQRMEYARQLLLERELNIAQVAKKVGYASQSNFAIAFRKKFGVNPKVFVKEL